MPIRDRIVNLRRVKANTLQVNEDNWSTHPEPQRASMEAVLTEIGYADALLARELPDGRLQLLDGHLRAEVTPDDEVPVLVVDLDDDESRLLLAVHDSLPTLAETDEQSLSNLIQSIETADAAIDALFDSIVSEDHGLELAKTTTDDEQPRSSDFRGSSDSSKSELDLKPVFQIVVECADEADQRTVYEQMTKSGRPCRVLSL